jgi:lipid-A-disaccharide synthase
LLVDRQARAGILRVFASLHRLLRQDTAKKAAAAILPYLKNSLQKA